MAQSVVIGLPISGNENAYYQPEFQSYSTNGDIKFTNIFTHFLFAH